MAAAPTERGALWPHTKQQSTQQMCDTKQTMHIWAPAAAGFDDAETAAAAAQALVVSQLLEACQAADASRQRLQQVGAEPPWQ